MKQYKNLLFEIEAGIGLLTLNRPQALNALNAELLRELDSLMDEIAQQDDVKVVIVTGCGEKSFVAGADIAEMLSLSVMEGRKFAQFGQRLLNKLENLPQPVIAAINGFALGGGCELAMACDIRIASDKAKFGQPEVKLGILPGFGGSQRLPRLIGKGRALELLYTGEIIDANEAYRLGLINKITSSTELLSAARAMAQTIMAGAENAVKLCKAAVNRGLDMDIASAISYEAETFGLCFATDDQQEGMTAFVEKRKANFTGK